MEMAARTEESEARGERFFQLFRHILTIGATLAKDMLSHFATTFWRESYLRNWNIDVFQRKIADDIAPSA